LDVLKSLRYSLVVIAVIAKWEMKEEGVVTPNRFGSNVGFEWGLKRKSGGSGEKKVLLIIRLLSLPTRTLPHLQRFNDINHCLSNQQVISLQIGIHRNTLFLLQPSPLPNTSH